MLGQISNNFIKDNVIFKNNYNMYLHLDYKGVPKRIKPTYLYLSLYIDIDMCVHITHIPAYSYTHVFAYSFLS